MTVAATLCTAEAASVSVTMNSLSPTMTLAEKSSGEMVEIGTPSSRKYTFETPAGKYVLTAYATDGTTVNGTLVLSIADTEDTQNFSILTGTAYATNKNEDGSSWSIENGDYSVSVMINDANGTLLESTVGNSTTAGRKTFLVPVNGNYIVWLNPSESHVEEGFLPLKKSGAPMVNPTVSGAIPKGSEFTVSLPADAGFTLATKIASYAEFAPEEPRSETTAAGLKTLTYFLADGQVYNYRTWREGGLTQAGYFTMSTDVSKCPQLQFSEADYAAASPATINHSVEANGGYETGNIFVNINREGYLRMNVGEVFDAHAMRSWQLTDNITANYFFEPDFHYTIINLDGTPSDGVLELAQTPGSAWTELRAIGTGTVIVLVTYDAIQLNLYNSSGAATNVIGGNFWGAIWPENTAAYVVSVGEAQSAVVPEMIINEGFVNDASKLAGKYVDAESDVFYFPEGTSGCSYTFTPQGAAGVTMAYPAIGERMATYTGFGNEGVTANDDGSYTLLLKEGRQIARLTDAAGNSTYQVLTAAPCRAELINVSRPGSNRFLPGDAVKVQFSGLFHPANKLAAFYNMSASVVYNALPTGVTGKSTTNQYTFGSSAAAQSYQFTIPKTLEPADTPTLTLASGALKISGFGDPIGSHRLINHTAGRQANFNAVSHQSCFGLLPDIEIPVSEAREFTININCNVPDADIQLESNGVAVAVEDNVAHGTYGTYTLMATREGYRCFHGKYSIADDNDGPVTFTVEMAALNGAWDGHTITEPAISDNEYQIFTPAELAWLAANVNSGVANVNARLHADLNLGGFEWTPIGNASSKFFGGNFNGDGHTINDLYINKSNSDYQGLFGYVKGTADARAIVSGISVDGVVCGKRYTAGVVGCAHQYSTVTICANNADITGTGTGIGGVVGQLGHSTATVDYCYNTGSVSGPEIHAGVVGTIVTGADHISNVFNVGAVQPGEKASAVVGSTYSKANVTNSFAIADYAVRTGYTLVSPEQMASGEIAYILGEPFGQEIGVQPYPVFYGETVKYDPELDVYYNGDHPTVIYDAASDGDVAPTLYYNLQGIPSTKPYRGLNIVRMTDGTCRKILLP